MSRFFALLAAGLVALGTAGNSLQAADNPEPKKGKGPAFIEPPKNDPNLIGNTMNRCGSAGSNHLPDHVSWLPAAFGCVSACS